jgi:hypothetical protein
VIGNGLSNAGVLAERGLEGEFSAREWGIRRGIRRMIDEQSVLGVILARGNQKGSIAKTFMT